MKIQVTFEVTKRICEEYEVTKEQLADIKDGKLPYWDDLKADAEKNGDTFCDYAVADERGCTIVDWD